jgi:hypothetical protein
MYFDELELCVIQQSAVTLTRQPLAMVYNRRIYLINIKTGRMCYNKIVICLYVFH